MKTAKKLIDQPIRYGRMFLHCELDNRERIMRHCALLVVGAFCLASFGSIGIAVLPVQAWAQELDPVNLQQMIGQSAPAWNAQGWVNSKPLDVKDLQGKVVLLRFINDNPTGASALNELYRTYRERGFEVVGLYAPQPMPEEISLDHVRQLAASLDFQFPVGLDSRWETLNRYWLQRADADFTGTTFLIDRKGVIRYIQADGLYEKNSPRSAMRREYAKLEGEIETLLKSGEEPAEKKTEKPKPSHFFGHLKPW